MGAVGALIAVTSLCLLVSSVRCQQPEEPGASSSSVVTQTLALEPFQQVRVFVPLSVLIQPGEPDEYALVLTAEPSVIEQVATPIQDGVLDVDLSGPIQTSFPIQITLRLPSDELIGVRNYGKGKSSCGHDGSGFQRELLSRTRPWWESLGASRCGSDKHADA